MAIQTLREKLDGTAVAPAMTMAKARELGYRVAKRANTTADPDGKRPWIVTKAHSHGLAYAERFASGSDALQAIVEREGLAS